MTEFWFLFDKVVLVWIAVMLTGQTVLLYMIWPQIKKAGENSETFTKFFKKPGAKDGSKT